MRSTTKWIASAMAFAAFTTACSRDAASFSQDVTIKMTANCTGPNEIFVDVDKWQAELNRNGDVTFDVSSTSTPAAVVTIAPKPTDPWPFQDPKAFRPKSGDNKRKAKNPNRKTTYYYNLHVACATGTGTDSTRVVIDPDIIVN